MTVKRRHDDVLEAVADPKTTIYRVILLVVVGSITPVGDAVLPRLGIERTDIREMRELRSDFDGMRARLDRLENSTQTATDKLEVLTTRITGFEIDFQRYKTK